MIIITIIISRTEVPPAPCLITKTIMTMTIMTMTIMLIITIVRRPTCPPSEQRKFGGGGRIAAVAMLQKSILNILSVF